MDNSKRIIHIGGGSLGYFTCTKCKKKIQFVCTKCRRCRNCCEHKGDSVV